MADQARDAETAPDAAPSLFAGTLPRIVAVALRVSVHQAWVRLSVDGDGFAVEHDLGSYDGGGMYYKRRYATRHEAEARGDRLVGDYMRRGFSVVRDEGGQGAWVVGDAGAPARA